MDSTCMGKLVLVVDDNAFNRDGVALYLRSNGYTTLEAGDEATAYAVAEANCPAAAVVDIVIPATPTGPTYTSQSVGLRLVRRLKTLDPTMGVVIFSAYEDRGSEIWDLVRGGTRGIAYMLKGTRPERLVQHLADTCAGRIVLEPSVSGDPRVMAEEIRVRLTPAERPWVEQAIALCDGLSPREMEVASRLAASHTYQGIAEALGITPKTVENHIGRVYDKLGLSEVDSRAPHLRKAVLLTKACMIYDLTRPEGSPA